MKEYPAMFHYIHKALSEINYPISKEELIKAVGDKYVPIDWDKRIPFAEILQPIQQSVFGCAAEFYCFLIASL